MARGDDAQIYRVTVRNGVIDPTSLNDVVRRIMELIYALEGRTGTSTIRDDLRVMGDLTVEGNLDMPDEGEVTSEEEVVATVDDGFFLPKVPACRVFNRDAISLPDGIPTTLEFDTEHIDNDDMFDASGDPTQIVIRRAGVYAVGLQARWAPNVTGVRSLTINADGVPIANGVAVADPTSGEIAFTISTIEPLQAGAILTASSFQNSGFAIDIQSTEDYTPVFWAVYVSAI